MTAEKIDILVYNELQPRRAEAQFERVVKFLENGDFFSAEVKKMNPSSYFRARLNDADRLLFAIMKYQGKRVILLLEIIYNHEYEKSRFLQGAAIDESKIAPLHSPEEIADDELKPLIYCNPDLPVFHFLDRCLSFDAAQYQLLNTPLPVIIVGSAGSGKTVLSLEKMKSLSGNILYATRSAYLANHAQRVYFAYSYDNTHQNVRFMSLNDVLANIRTPEGSELTFSEFSDWLRRNRIPGRHIDTHQLFEEISGVLTGNNVEVRHLSLEEYLALGVKQSIFPESEREIIYGLFSRLLVWMKENNRYLGNILCYDYLPLATAEYDYLFVDEVQDLTCVQLLLLLKQLRNPFNFLLSGDSNQIVHPNFFSWSAVKTLFYKGAAEVSAPEINILHANYRNSQSVTELANRILRWKVARFGSVDRESNFLVACTSALEGKTALLKDSPATRQQLNEQTAESIHYAVLVMRDEDKAAARQLFKTPLVFSVQEAKGLEYRNIIIYNFVSSSLHEFDEITGELQYEDLPEGELPYARGRDKSDHSLETYKFYVNSLYVAVTRAVENIYWLENRADHKTFSILGLKTAGQDVRLAKDRSSLDEWRQEAERLKEHGKQEQAEAIQRSLLQLQPVPWKVLARQDMPELLRNALDYQKFSRKDKQLLLNCAVAEDFDLLIGRLVDSGYVTAQKKQKALLSYQSNYLTLYNPANRKKLMSSLTLHGVDFRDPLNRTSLMLACGSGDAALITELLAQEADIELQDNYGRQAFDYLCRYIYRNEHDAGKFTSVIKPLMPPHIAVRLNGRCSKIANQGMEFLILHFMLGSMPEIIAGKTLGAAGIAVDEIVEFLHKLPDFMVPEYRRSESYISSILAEQEPKLFIQVRDGRFLPNPALELQYGGNYLAWDSLVEFRFYGDYNRGSIIPALQVYLNNSWPLEQVERYWNALNTVRNYPVDMTREYIDELTEVLQLFEQDAQMAEFCRRMIALTDDLPPLPDTLEALLKLRGKGCTDRRPLFLNYNSLAEFPEFIRKRITKAEHTLLKEHLNPEEIDIQADESTVVSVLPEEPEKADDAPPKYFINSFIRKNDRLILMQSSVNELAEMKDPENWKIVQANSDKNLGVVRPSFPAKPNRKMRRKK